MPLGRARLVDFEDTSQRFSAIELLNGGSGFFFRAHIDEGEPLRLSSGSIIDDADRGHFSSLSKYLLEIGCARIVREIADK